MTWFRVYGDGTPYDHSAGASTEDDYRGPPVLRVVTPEPNAEAIEPVEAIPDALEPFSIYPQPTPVEREPVEPATGWRLLAKFLRSKQENP